MALSPEEAARESKSVLIGGGLEVGLATGAVAGAALAGPVCILAGATVGAVVGVVGNGALGEAINTESTSSAIGAPTKVESTDSKTAPHRYPASKTLSDLAPTLRPQTAAQKQIPVGAAIAPELN